jgi:hypothetical protein
VVAVAQLTVVLDSTIVNIALPSAQHALGFANSDRQWVVTGYALAFGSLLLDDVFAHPRHEAAQQALPGLIVQQRAAANVKDGYELQLELIGHVRETEEARNAFSKAVKRMQDGKSPQLDAPEPQPGRDPSLLETCSSNTACASALPGSSAASAMRLPGGSSASSAATSSPVPERPVRSLAGKAGAPAELDAVEQAYRQDGQFAILHDMTNCLRIGDVAMVRRRHGQPALTVPTPHLGTNPGPGRGSDPSPPRPALARIFTPRDHPQMRWLSWPNSGTGHEADGCWLAAG